MPSTLEDRDEILQLLYRYNHAIDGGDAEGWADTFTEDAEFDVAGHVTTGREALVKFASDVHGTRHIVSNPLIEVTGDTAAVRAYLVVYHGMQMVTIGSYQDELVRTPAGWRFARRAFTPDPQS
ncbi:MAG: nuclear transport factor 2 family protein [Acidimicrobiaceae bacterium]|nr:nuclear transport factor 2 family protein [Acidimicrobiaceae bacterium]